MDITLLVALVIALALFFDFTNGFHDTANAMATPIATGALRPKVAVAIAAVLNLVGAFLSTEVARTISGGLIREGDGGVQITPVIVFAGLIGAIVWNLATWFFGLPSSSSHALFGGLIGATIVGAGFGAIDPGVLHVQDRAAGSARTGDRVHGGARRDEARAAHHPACAAVPQGFRTRARSSRRRWSRSRTAPTTPRRRWGSSP